MSKRNIQSSDLPSSVGNDIRIPLPPPTNSAADAINLTAAQMVAASVVTAGGHPTIKFQAAPVTSTTAQSTVPYYLPNGIQVQQGVAYEGELPVIAQQNQGSGYLPDGEPYFIGGTVIQGNGTNSAFYANNTPVSDGSFNPNTLGATQIGGVSIRKFAINNFVNGIQIGALQIMGLEWSAIDEIYVTNCTGWGVQMINYQHVTFGKISTWLCTNGQYYGSQGSGTYFDPGNSTHYDIFHKSINTTGQARNVVFEANATDPGGAAGLTIGRVVSLQVNAYNQHDFTQTATLTNGNSAIGVTDATKYSVGMPVYFATAGGNLTALITYVVQSVNVGAETITIGTSKSASAFTPNASTTLTMHCSGFAGVEIACFPAGDLTGRFDYIDIEGSPNLGIYGENWLGVEVNIHSAAGGISLRNCPNSRVDSQMYGLITDFDSGTAGGTSFNGKRATPLAYTLAGQSYDTTRGGAWNISVGKGQSASGGGDIESRHNGLLYPVQAGVAHHIIAQGSSKSLSEFQCGEVVVPAGSGSGITYTLPTIVTQTSPGSIGNANVGLWYEIVNLSSSAITISTNGTQVINQQGSFTSLSLGSLQKMRFVAMESGSSTQFWLAYPAQPLPTSNAGTLSTNGGIAAGALITATNASWPIPGGANLLLITAVGGGGGGGGGGSSATGTLQAGGAGGAAGVSVTQVVPVGANTSLNVTIGAGGTGGAGGAAGSNTGIAGNPGNNTTVTGTGISVEGVGGAAGSPSAGSSVTVVNGGAYGGSAAGGGGGTGNSTRAGDGGASNHPAGPAVAFAGGGGGGAAPASASNGGLGGNAGTTNAGGSQGSGQTGSTAGGVGGSAAANTGAGGGGGGGGNNGTGAGASGGAGGSGFVVIQVIG